MIQVWVYCWLDVELNGSYIKKKWSWIYDQTLEDLIEFGWNSSLSHTYASTCKTLTNPLKSLISQRLIDQRFDFIKGSHNQIIIVHGLLTNLDCVKSWHQGVQSYLTWGATFLYLFKGLTPHVERWNIAHASLFLTPHLMHKEALCLSCFGAQKIIDASLS